MTQSMFTIRGI